MSLSPGSILFVFANTTQCFLQDRKYFTLLTRLLKIDFRKKILKRDRFQVPIKMTGCKRCKVDVNFGKKFNFLFEHFCSEMTYMKIGYYDMYNYDGNF